MNVLKISVKKRKNEEIKNDNSDFLGKLLGSIFCKLLDSNAPPKNQPQILRLMLSIEITPWITYPIHAKKIPEYIMFGFSSDRELFKFCTEHLKINKINTM